MRTLEEEVKYLVDAGLENADIADFLECSKRSVRRYANPYRLEKQDPSMEVDLPKILLFDLETAPMEFYGWSLKTYSGYIPPVMVKKSWSILCYSAKWLFDNEIMHGSVTPEEAYNREDGSIIQKLWALLDSADIVISHNGDQFDIKRSNTRFKVNGLGPPMPFRSIDTLKKLRSVFALDSYKLDYVNMFFGLNTKKGNEEGMNLWKKCVKDNEDSEKALGRMQTYCDNDVMILEELYTDVRPWIKGHPNLGLYIDIEGEKCTRCGGTDLDWRGYYYTPAGRYRAFRCRGCSSVGRSRTSDLTPEERKGLCLNVV